jgi:predicted Zn-dependent protease
LNEDSSTFEAEAFHSNPEIGVVTGKIILERFRLRFVSPALQLEIPLARLQIQLDPEVSGRICFTNPDQPEWTLCTVNSRVLEQRFLREQPFTRNQIRELEGPREFKRRLAITLGVLGVFALIALVGSIATGMMVRALVAGISPEWEQQIGDDLMAELKKTELIIQDPKLIAKLDRAVGPLLARLPAGKREYKFYLLQESMANAFALPGGHVLVTTRLLELAERPEEIAGVVAHELAHVTQKHGFRKIISSAGPYLIFRVFLGNSAGVLPILGDSSELLIRQSFSQEYELEADEVGWQTLVNARIDPRGLAEMLRKLQAEHKKLQTRGHQVTAFSSHPATAKRLQRLDAKWNKLKDKSNFVPL